MKKCKKCHRQISIMEEYCSECLKNLSLREKLIEELRKEHFFQSGSTNRSFGNFSEYALKSSLFASQCRSPKFFATQKTFLNPNIKLNSQVLLQARQS